MLFDGQAFNPNPVTVLDRGAAKTVKMPGATLLPNAFGLAGFNQHAWTGAWGTVTYWNALVANLELMGIGRFFAPRPFTPQFPIAIKRGVGNQNPTLDPDNDRVTKNLAALHFSQLAIPSPRPRPGIDFDLAAARRGDELFGGKANCNTCHVEPLWTEPGWNLHPSDDLQPNPATPPEFLIDDFQANRAPAFSSSAARTRRFWRKATGGRLPRATASRRISAFDSPTGRCHTRRSSSRNGGCGAC